MEMVGAAVTGSDGATLGEIVDIMLAADAGSVVYVVIAVGGLLGIGERLFALPWHLLAFDGGKVTATVAAADLGDRPGFDKDAWPTAADPFFAGFATA
jgi:hypothetical protein